MKKALLVASLPLLVLVGCGGGGGGDTSSTGTPGNNDVNSGDTNNEALAATETITINFPPVAASAKRLIDTSDMVRNAARLVVRQQGKKCDDVPIYETTCVDFVNEYGDEEQECTTTQTGTKEECVNTELSKKVKDSPLDDSGAGSASISIPPGVDYTLEVLTYIAGARAAVLANEHYAFGCEDNGEGTWEKEVCTTTDGVKTCEQEVCPALYDTVYTGDFTKLPITDATVNYHLMDEYGFSNNSDGETLDTFTVTTGEPIIAELSLEDEVVQSGTQYTVGALKSDAVRATWYLRDAQVDGQDLANQWYVRDESESGRAVSSDAITLMAPDQTGTGTQEGGTFSLYHQGQFFMNSQLLDRGESSTAWTFVTTDAGLLNPLGTVIIDGGLNN
jgi:hypothetical protein